MKKMIRRLAVTATVATGVIAGGIAHASTPPVSDTGSIKFAAFEQQAAQADVLKAIAVEDLTNGNVCGAGC